MAGTCTWQVLLLVGVMLSSLQSINCGTPRESTYKITERDLDASVDEKDKVTVFTSNDGSFILQDYKKGLIITRDTETGICRVAVMHQSAADGDALQQDLKAGAPSHVVLKRYEVLSVSEKISDTSFIPSVAHLYCTEGYQWVTASTAARTSGLVTQKSAKSGLVKILLKTGEIVYEEVLKEGVKTAGEYIRDKFSGSSGGSSSGGSSSDGSSSGGSSSGGSSSGSSSGGSSSGGGWWGR